MTIVAQLRRGLLLACLLACLGTPARGQMDFTASNLATGQTFDAIGASGTSLSGIGWFVSDGTTQNQTLTGVVTGNQNTASLAHGRYNCASTGNAPDRAVGLVASGSGVHRLGTVLTNSTGSTITNLAFSATAEKYRNGSSTATNEVNVFQYKVSGTNLNDATGWTTLTALSLPESSSNLTATTTAIDGNLAANKRTVTGSFALSLTNGQVVWIRWIDADSTGTDALIALDDFSVTAQVSSASNPDISILGNATAIADGDATPTVTDHTDFATVGVNQSNLVRTFTVTNSGSATLVLQNAAIGGTHPGDFSVSTQLASTSLAVGATTTFSVTFNPTAAGTRTATIYVSNNVSGKNPYDFVIQGTGVLAGILRSPTSITVTTMVGTAPGASSFGVTNVGRGRLDYAVTTNAAWLSVSPTSAQLAELAGQQETITYDVTGLYAGTSNAMVTITDAGASNSPQTVAVTLTLTNIVDSTAQSATADGKELVRLAWTKPSAHNVLIAYQLGSAPGTPANGTSYAVGAAVPGGGTVIYSGSGATLEHVVRTNAAHYYKFFSINNNHYSPGVSANATTLAYDAGEVVDAMAYTNSVTLNGVNGGAGWSGAWSVGSGTFTAETSSLSIETNYPTPVANRIRVADPGNGGQPYATRSFPALTSGKLYVGALVSYQYQGPWKFAGFSLVSNTTEKVFLGKIPNSENNRFGLTSTRNSTDYKTSSVTLGDFNTSTGNVYLVVGSYDFATRVFQSKVYPRTTSVPEAEPVSWDVTTNFPANYANSLDGVRLASGALGVPDGSIGQTLFDEVRVATNWSALLGLVPVSEIALLGTNGASIATGDESPSTTDGTDFGQVYFAGSASYTNTFSITNSGNAALTISGITTSSAMGAAGDFAVLAWPPSVLAGTKSNLVVAFNPQAIGVRTALVSIANNDGDENPYTFVLSGEGTGAFSTITFQGAEGSATDTWTYSFVTNAASIYIDGDTNASGAYAMTLRGSASSNADPYIEFDNIDISDYASVTLAVSFAVAGLDSGDDLELDISHDGGTTWSGPGSTTLVYGAANTNVVFGEIGSTTVPANPWYVSIPATTTQIRVRIRLDESTNDNTFDRAFVDNIRLTGAGLSPFVSFGAAVYHTSETNGTLTVPVAISSAADATVRVALAGSALGGGTDYSVNSTNLVFSSGGGTTSNIVFTLANDALGEGLEDVVLVLTRASGAVVGGPAVSTILLQDDDAFSVMSANLTGGTNIVDGTYTYDEAAQRIIRRLRPDVLAIQEWKFTNASARAFVDSVLGTNYHYYIEPETDPNPIPNGVISRWPITASNEWTDVYVGARDHVRVTIDVPGPRDLHVVSTHFKAGAADAATRENQARALTNFIAAAAIPTNDFLVIAGDLNLTNRTETTFVVLTQIVSDANQPMDTAGVRNSSLGKTSPFDHVLPNGLLDAEHLPVRVGGHTFTNGMIFDTTQFSEHLLPALVDDSYVTNRSHHGVVKLFNLSTSAIPPTVTTTIASATNATTATAGGQVTSDGGATVTNRGVVWATTSSPTVPGSQTTNGTGTGSFSSTLTNLTPGATYYYRAFAQNSAGTGYGLEYSLTTPCFAGSVTGLVTTVTNDTNFTASWSNFAGATGYQLDVSTNGSFSGGATLLATQGFEGGGGDTWGYTQQVATISTVTTTSRTGATSLRLESSGEARFGNISLAGYAAATVTIAFASSGVDSGEDLFLELSYDSGSTWTDSVKLVDGFSNALIPFNTTNSVDPTTVSPNPYPYPVASGATQVMIRTRVTGLDASEYYFVDDISLVGAGGAPTYVDGYSNRAVSSTSQSVTGLTSGVAYYYRVRATNEFCTSLQSATVSVTTISLAADVSVLGNSVAIADGDTSPSPTDHTDFGRVGLTNSNLVRTFTVTNTGNASLSVGNVTTSGAAASDFVVLSQPSTPITAGGTSTFQVRFDPSATGVRTATLQFTNNVAAKSPYDFVVQGTGVAAGISYGPASISVTTMVGSAVSARTVAVTNVGLGQLVFGLTTNASWLSVSPTSGTLAEGQAQTSAVSFAVNGLAAGVSNATITIADAGASNSPQTVSVSLTLTNIPGPTSVVVSNDGPELNRLSWTPPSGLQVLVLHRATNAPSAPSSATAYSIGDSIGSDGTRVIYKGAATNLQHVVSPSVQQHYAVYAINNDHYSGAISTNVTMGAYEPGRIIEQFAYTNGVNLHGVSGGQLWTNAWSDSNPGAYSITNFGLPDQTNYPAGAANMVVVDPPSASARTAFRNFAGVTSGRIYVGFKINIYYNGPDKYAGVSFVDGTTEEMFYGEGFGGDEKLAVGGTVSGSNLLAGIGNDYIVIGVYDFGTDEAKVVAYKAGTHPVPESEPSVWHATYNDSSITRIDGIRLASGASSGTPGPTRFDDIRVATNWAGIVPSSGSPGIGVSPTNISVSVMRGSSPALQTFAVSNIGAGVLSYTVSTSAYWITTAPSLGTLGAGASQVHTATLSTASLGVGTNLGTITITDSLATNSPRTVAIQVVVTNIPPPTNVVAYADGNELVRLGWTIGAGLEALVLHDDTAIALDPSQGGVYTNGSIIGGARVIYRGTNTALEHVVAPGSTNHYAIYAANGNYFSSAGTNTVIDCPDPTATNLVAGDIALIGLNTLTVGSTNYDSFGFVNLVDLPQGTQIKFTDNGWRSNNTFRTGEGTLTWQATNCVPAGTAIRWIATNNPVVTVGLIVATNGSFSPNIDGEQLLVYQGAETNPVFLYALASHTNGGSWTVDAVDTHSSALPLGLTNGLTAVSIAELNNVVLSTNQLSVSGDRLSVLTYISNSNNWVGDDSLIFDLLAYSFTFPGLNTSGGGVMTNVTMGVYRTNEIVDAFAYTSGVSMTSISRNGGWGWTSDWKNAAGTWSVLSNNHAEVSFPSAPLYPTNAANMMKLADPGVSTTGRIHRSFQPVTNGSLYVSAFLAYQYEGFGKFAGLSFMSGAAETGFVGKVSDPAYSFTLGIDTYGGAKQFAAYDLRGLENSTNNTYLLIGRYDFSTKQIRVQAYYRGVSVPDTEPAAWAATATLSGAGIPLIDGIRVHAGADSGTIGNAYFDEVRVATSWGALINRNPPDVLTRPVSNILTTAATGGGEVTSDGGASVTNRGIVWGTNAVPTFADNTTSDGTGTGAYSSSMTTLVPGQTYYVRAFAQNAAGTSYGAVSNFTALCFTSVVAGLYANPTNSQDFTANWSGLPGATLYEVDVSTVSNFSGAAGNYGTEVFTNMGGGTSSSYLTRDWTNNGINWVGYKARTDQTLTGEAITLQDASGSYLVSGNITGGVDEISFRHQMKFSGSSGTFDVFVNSVKVATNVVFDANIQTARVTGIGVAGSFTVMITNSGVERLAIDDLAWTNGTSGGSYVAGYEARSTTNVSLAITGLTEGVRYYYRVRAVGGGACESDNSATATVVTVDTVGPIFTAFGVSGITNATITDFQLANAITVLVTAADAGGVNWNGASIAAPDFSPYFSITSPLGAGIVSPVAFGSAGHVDGESPSVMTGVVTASAVTTGSGFRVFITAADNSFTNVSLITNLFNVIDDDTATPTVASADISYGGVGNRYFSITTNASPVLAGNRAGSFSDVRYTMTDGDLNEAAARDLRFAFGIRDAESGVALGTAGNTNTVASFSLGSVISGNFTNYRADLSSANYTNARTTNVWAFPSGFFTESMINTLMGAPSNLVTFTAPDDDADRANDGLVLYAQPMGWLTVVDDDTSAPSVQVLTVNGLGAGTGVTSLYVETIGSTGANGDTIATHESNNRFDLDGPTMSGSGDIRNTSASSVSDYAGASGANNVMLNTSTETFTIAGLDTSGYTDLKIAFGVRKNTTGADGSGLALEVSTNGSSWTTLTVPALPTGSGTATWFARTNSAGTVPASTNLHIRFTSSDTTEWRIDDIRVLYTVGNLQLTDGALAAGGYVITGSVQDVDSGITVSNARAPYYVLLNTNGQAVVSNSFATAFTNGATSQQALTATAPAAFSTNVVMLGTNNLYIVAGDTDNDRSADFLSTTGTPLPVLVVDDDTNAPAVSGFFLAGGTTNLDLGIGSAAITGLLSDVSGTQYGGPTHVLLFDSAGAIVQSNVLYAGSGSAATGTVTSLGLFCGQDYTVRVFAVDADGDRPGDSLAVAQSVFVLHTTGAGGPADYPTATNLLVNGAAASPSVTLFDATIRTGGWSLAMSLSHPVGLYTNASSPYFRVTNGVGEVIGPTPFTNAAVSGSLYAYTNFNLAAGTFANITTGLQYVVWSASNQGSCVADVVDRSVIAAGTNTFLVTDDDTDAPSVTALFVAGGLATIDVATALSGFAVTGLVQDATSGVGFTSRPPYALFYDVTGSVLASNRMTGGVEGSGAGAAAAITNWFSGLSLSCGNVYTILVVAADADVDRPSDATSSNAAFVLTMSGAGGDAPTASNLLITNAAAAAVALTDASVATGGWRAALTITHSSGALVTNGPNAPAFQVLNPSGSNVHAASSLSWSNIEKSGVTYYATNTSVPAALTNLVETGRYSFVWSARSDALCFGETNGSTFISPGTNRFLVVDDDILPPNFASLSVAGGSGSGGGFDCPDPTATNLVAGDIAIFAMNTRTVGSGPGATNADSFAFVALVDLPSGTQIKFTDNGWKSSTSSFRSNEGTLTWRATNCLAAGSVVRWVATNSPVWSSGITSATNGSFAPNILGEQIFAYQGSDSSPNFIYGLNDRLNGVWDVDAVDSHSSALPPGLIDGYTAVAVGEFDNIILSTNSLTIAGDRESILYYIGDAGNWIGDDTNTYDLAQFNFTFPDANATGGQITDGDVAAGTWSITGVVQDVYSGLMVSNDLGLRYVVVNTNSGQVASNYFSTTFANGVTTAQAFSNNVIPGTYAAIQLGVNTAQLFAADIDADRPLDWAQTTTNVPFVVVDDDTDLPQVGYFTINGQTTITNTAELASVVISGQVRDVTSGMGFTSAPPTYAVYDSLGAAVVTGAFTYAPSVEGAGVDWTNIWTTNLNLSGIADCGIYTVRVTVADADNDRAGDSRSTNVNFLIGVAGGGGGTDSPVATNLLVNGAAAGVATVFDELVSTGGWSLAVTITHPGGISIDPPSEPEFVLRNAATSAVLTQVWANISTIAGGITATNTNLPAVTYSLVDTGYYSVVWSARSQGTCFGETNLSPLVAGDTNRFLVVDDDTTAPPPVTNVVNTAAEWTNLVNVSISWSTNGLSDASGVTLRIVTNGPAPASADAGTALAYTSTHVLTNVLEGVTTNWLFAADNDNDRANDQLAGASTGIVLRIDRTPPLRVTNVSAVAGAVDNSSEIDLTWNALPDAGGSNLSPWRTYAVFYTEGPVGPFPTSSMVTADNSLPTLGTNTTTSITVGGLTFDTTYRVAMAGIDRAGNIGPLSVTQTVTLGSFAITQAVANAEDHIHLSHTWSTGKEYDLIYVDATNYADSLTNAWGLAERGTGSLREDTGTVSRIAPLQLGGNTMRFYRAALRDKWASTNQPSRVASVEVYAAKPLSLAPGQNFVSLFSVPDDRTIANILGTNRLPWGGVLATSTVVSFYNETPDGQPSPVTLWLNHAGYWLYSTGGIANAEQLPVREGFNITIPTTAPTQRVVVIGRVPTNDAVQSLSAGAYHVLGYSVPRLIKMSETGLKEAGLKTGPTPSVADEIRVLQKGPGGTASPEARIIHNGTNYIFWSSRANANNYVLKPDNAVIIYRRPGSPAMSWTNKTFYSPPGRNMNP